MTYITVPDENDSIGHVSFDGNPYIIRFTWNRYGGFWSFGLYTNEYEPILAMTRIVVGSPLTEYYTESEMPDGHFIATSDDGSEIGRDDFKDGKAKFIYLSNSEIEGS